MIYEKNMVRKKYIVFLRACQDSVSYFTKHSEN